MRLFFIISSLGVCCLWFNFENKNLKLPKSEFVILEILATLGFMILAQVQHFALLFVALELGSLCACFLITYDKDNKFCISAGIKYLILNAISSAILLMGIVLIYGFSAHIVKGGGEDILNFSQLGNVFDFHTLDLWGKIGIVLITAGISFKIGAVPFQVWIPDIYKNAPLPATAFLAISSKAAGFCVLFSLISGPFASIGKFIEPLLITLAILTIFLGTIGAVVQKNLKSIIAFSGIAHSGYLLIGLSAVASENLWISKAIVVYLYTYMLASFVVIGSLSLTASSIDEEQKLSITDHEGLYKKSPFLAIALAIGLGSLAGMPPLAGFIAKVLLIIGTLHAKLYMLIAIALICTAISIYYYFGWIRECFFSTITTEFKAIPISLGSKLVLSTVAVSLIVIGFYQKFFDFIF